LVVRGARRRDADTENEKLRRAVLSHVSIDYGHEVAANA
jgi:hypothetical protein